MKLRIYPVLIIPLIALFFVNPASATSPLAKPSTNPTLHISTVNPYVSLLDPSFDPNAAVGGVPFCSSGSLGTILCYPASWLKVAYNFPGFFGHGGLTGKGSTVVIVDAFGSPTVQSDLNTYDTTFGLPAATVTILCGPTWTGASTDACPLNTVADIATVAATPAGLACGGVPGVTSWAEETTLDVSQVHALAPGAHIVLVVANDCYDTSIYGAEQAVVNQHKYDGSIMSQSFGEPDDLVTCTALDPTNSYCVSYDPSLLNLPNSVFQTATKHHWTIIASTGDDGANEAARVTGTLELTPSFPATNPLVLAAGGTQGSPYGGKYGGAPGPGGTFSCAAFQFCNTGLLVINGGLNGCGTAARPGEPSSCVPVAYGGESAWNEAIAFQAVGYSTGGGVSSLYSRPSYQDETPKSVTTLLGTTVSTLTGRTTPDVSFNSAVYGGVLAYLGFLGRWAVFGGTSASSPAWAAIIALLNEANGDPVGFINPAIYSLAESTHGGFGFFGPFHDITSGNNADCSGLCGEDGFVATRGYDLTTGWGTPNVSAFIQGIQHYLQDGDSQ